MNPRECREALGLFGRMFDASVRQKTAVLAEMLRAKRSDIDIEVGEIALVERCGASHHGNRVSSRVAL